MISVNKWLFEVAEYLSSPPGFYQVLAAMAFATVLVPFGWTDVVTYALSVLAIVITGVVLIQGYRDTTALHAKLDEVIIALREARNDLVGLEHRDPEEIAEKLLQLEEEAGCSPAVRGRHGLPSGACGAFGERVPTPARSSSLSLD